MILEDYGKGVLCPEVIAAALDGARRKGVPVVVDPTGRDYRRYAGATVLTPNLKEAAVAAERPITDLGSLEAAASLLVEQTGAALAVTREAEGISLFRRSESGGPIAHTHVPTVPVAVFDVTGAGDAVAASLAVALASGLEMVDACTVANLAGRAVVKQFGVGTISVAHLLAEARSEAADWMVKVVDVPSARRHAHEIKQAGGKVVFTNGCFDILHYGHAHLLQFARSQGDFLVLGLNTDASVRRFKGPTRPFVAEDQRAYMLSLYPFVDLIVLFDEDTPLNLIEAIRPDVLVKGGDYTPETVVGRDCVESYGGRVAICPRLEGLSTTDLVRKQTAIFRSNAQLEPLMSPLAKLAGTASTRSGFSGFLRHVCPSLLLLHRSSRPIGLIRLEKTPISAGTSRQALDGGLGLDSNNREADAQPR